MHGPPSTSKQKHRGFEFLEPYRCTARAQHSAGACRSASGVFASFASLARHFPTPQKVTMQADALCNAGHPIGERRAVPLANHGRVACVVHTEQRWAAPARETCIPAAFQNEARRQSRFACVDRAVVREAHRMSALRAEAFRESSPISTVAVV
ncbi:hypothetical protein BU26DRAFT_509286 [Trematosphaeria pertusa]|uniref:Uncharacterized protein n=1 Tax=Trematosphaeria pertusa TaxID=390896 RepID=A0A6A6I450_9PLEO|nr:uncharacterized protein BU26DRAFT_509286 [Trematosphaeria pertusa]KAF2244380.1 hypothetical protein BU26DRAFT_509286 [Trematosphaeria pertusa]